MMRSNAPAKAARRLAQLRGEFLQRPALMRWAVTGALGILPDQTPEIEETANYAQSALEYRDWDSALVDIDRVLASYGWLPSTPVGRKSLFVRFTARRMASFDDGKPYVLAWRILDATLSEVARGQKLPWDSPKHRSRIEMTLLVNAPSLDELRESFVTAIRSANPRVRSEAARLFSEAEESLEFALAGLDQKAWSAAKLDLERLDSDLRALRFILQREAPLLLPGSWLVRRLSAANIHRQRRRRRRAETLETIRQAKAFAANRREATFPE